MENEKLLQRFREALQKASNGTLPVDFIAGAPCRRKIINDLADVELTNVHIGTYYDQDGVVQAYGNGISDYSEILTAELEMIEREIMLDSVRGAR